MSSDDITLTQCGQPRPYADSVYAGTVKADSEQAARDKLQATRGGGPILDKQSREAWSSPYFTLFREESPGTWRFSITEEYTG